MSIKRLLWVTVVHATEELWGASVQHSLDLLLQEGEGAFSTDCPSDNYSDCRLVWWCTRQFQRVGKAQSREMRMPAMGTRTGSTTLVRPGHHSLCCTRECTNAWRFSRLPVTLESSALEQLFDGLRSSTRQRDSSTGNELHYPYFSINTCSPLENGMRMSGI